VGIIIAERLGRKIRKGDREAAFNSYLNWQAVRDLKLDILRLYLAED